eukprot:TRINITY_DN37372_c0_g1_i1.p1 TRINITY_DN37372_c0_g1~~TRINITY_DN37372_c0_g1_i1.p1  ORF type:complete len:334 (+),score=68.80 TRINITY_DN37372_c0_g1_i1:25-1002(+)
MKRTAVTCGRPFGYTTSGKSRISETTAFKENWSNINRTTLLGHRVAKIAAGRAAGFGLSPVRTTAHSFRQMLDRRIGHIAGISPDEHGRANAMPYMEGQTLAPLPGDSSSIHRMEALPVYEPEREQENVLEHTVAETGAVIRVICGDMRFTTAEAVCVTTDTELAPVETTGLYFWDHIEMQRQHRKLGGEPLITEVKAHYERFGTIPKGCVGRLPLPFAPHKYLICAHTPEFIDGVHEELQWLEAAYNGMFEDCKHTECKSLALHAAPDTAFPLELSAEVLARCVLNWAELDCLHHDFPKRISIYTETLEEAAIVQRAFENHNSA